MNNMFSMFNTFGMFGNTKKKYNPYINYTWQMLPNAKVKNVGTSGVDLQLYSGNPLDFQGNQYIPYVNTFENERMLSFGISFYDLPNWKTFPVLGNTINSNRIYFITKNTGTATFEIDNRSLGESTILPLSTLNFAIGTYYHITLTFKDRIVKCYINGVLDKTTTTTFSGLYFQQLLASLNRSEYIDAQMDYLIITNNIATQEQITQSVEQPNQFFKDMSTNSNTLFATDFRGNSSNIKDYKSGTAYSITNYSATQRTNFTQVNKGLQDLTRSFDSNGFFLDNVSYLNCNGKGKATIVEPSRTSNITIKTNPTTLSGNILSGGVVKTTTGLTVGIDNDIVLSNQVIASNIDIGVGYTGKISVYKEDKLS